LNYEIDAFYWWFIIDDTFAIVYKLTLIVSMLSRELDMHTPLLENQIWLSTDIFLLLILKILL